MVASASSARALALFALSLGKPHPSWDYKIPGLTNKSCNYYHYMVASTGIYHNLWGA
ncbi:MAG: hypothetical protein QOD00_1792 [Blastocatellia bacterium]|jgi:hypothetical protein|nr:hypothetical protein [Blastocatellia bacterium]